MTLDSAPKMTTLVEERLCALRLVQEFFNKVTKRVPPLFFGRLFG